MAPSSRERAPISSCAVGGEVLIEPVEIDRRRLVRQIGERTADEP